ncbi:MAG: hypothetical protein ACYTXE_41785 [Nostoc sp.]
MGKKLKTFFALAKRHEVRCVAREHIHPLHTSSLYGRGFPSAFCLLPSAFFDTDYLSVLSVWVDQALSNTHSVASDLEEAHQWLRRIAECLRYPEYSKGTTDHVTDITQTTKISLTSLQVRRDMEELLQQFQPDPQQNPAQFTLKKKLQKLWHKYGTDLLHCYDIPRLPQDNLKIESMLE